MERAGGSKGVKFGVVYYPEQWDRSLWRDDLKRIREMGATEVRLMEFAWSLIEPGPGRFDFSLFDEVLGIVGELGMKVVLGTPTATFPAWLFDADPSIVQIHESGVRRDWGARREACFNAPRYLKAARALVGKVAARYGRHPAVAGWQVDNEPGHEGSDVCVCGHCAAAWHRWLKAKYRDIGALNEAWGSVFWGRNLSSFAQAPVPRHQLSVTQNPQLQLDYDRFSSDSLLSFIGMQVAILRKHVPGDRFITTNMFMPPLGTVVDFEKMFAGMDLAGYDNYPVWGEMDEPLPHFFVSLILSYIRGLKGGAPFSVFEQFSGFQGHTCLGYRPPDERMVLWTNQAVAHGADRICYFRWRTAPFAQEQLCYGILDADGQDTTRYRTIKANIEGKGDALASFAGTRVESRACLLYDMDNLRVLKRQHLSKGLFNEPVKYLQIGYPMELARWYAPLALFNVNTDVRTPASVDLDAYGLVLLPLYQMADPDFAARLSEWVRAGGVLVLGWRAGARDMKDHAVRQELPGVFAEMAGVRVRVFESLNQTKVKIRAGIVPAKGEIWADVPEPVTAKAVARYTDGKKFYRGSPCVTVNRHGKGLVYYMGTSPDPVGLLVLFRKIIRSAGIKTRFYGKEIEVVRRRTADGGEVDILLNHSGKRKFVPWGFVPPYGMKVRKV